jgi:hypothetical protein
VRRSKPADRNPAANVGAFVAIDYDYTVNVTMWALASARRCRLGSSARRLFPWWTTRNTEGFAFGLKGDTGVTRLEAVAA